MTDDQFAPEPAERLNQAEQPLPAPRGPQNPGKAPRRQAAAAGVAMVVVAAAATFGIVHNSGAAATVASTSTRGWAGSPGYLPGTNQDPAQLPSRRQVSRYRDASHSSSLATSAQQVGVVDIYTVLSDGSEAAGTGIVLSSSGEVVTNNHVIEDSTRIRAVVVTSGRVYVARVRGTDATDDIAVLQLKGASKLATAALDSTEHVRAGDEVTGVGNAGGVGGTPSAATGTVVDVDRPITVHSESSGETEHLTGLIKVAADIQSGDSGGPLYDAGNDVIAIDTAASSGRTPVVGFAIPITTALAVVDEIEGGVDTSTVSIGYPGLLGVELLRGASGRATGGAYVAAVAPGLAAATAGIAAGDTITAIGATTVTSSSQLSTLIAAHHAGEAVSVSWIAPGGGTHSATVTLTRGPAA